MNSTNIEAAAAPAIARIEVKGNDAVRQWIKLKQMYEGMRGIDQGANKKPIPKTTVRDIKQLATQWSNEIKKVSPRTAADRTEHDRWLECLRRIVKLTEKLGPDVEYPENERFWQECSRRLAIYLESRKVVPSRWELITESIGEAITELPRVVGDATRTAAGAAAGLLSSPAKLGALILGGAILAPPLIRALRN